MSVFHQVLLAKLAALFFLLSTLGFAAGEAEFFDALCAKDFLYAAKENKERRRQYAPDRNVDILHVALDITPDFSKRTIAGKMAMKFSPIALPLRQLRLDAIGLMIQRVDSTAPLAEHQVNEEEIVITFSQPIPAGIETTVTIQYTAEPSTGLHFRTTEMGYPAGNDHLFTQGEPTMARYWYPCFDAPNEKFTTEMTCRVREGMIALANGKLLSQTRDEKTGLAVFHWLQDKPHANYLIALCAGYFNKIEDQYKNVPLAFYSPPRHSEYARNAFRGTKEMMEYFEKEIGLPFPWDRYDQVVVDDFGFGGMENTTLVVLNTWAIFPDEYENAHTSERLIAHELSHHWFGNYVTCKDWSQIWLNEGFASYYERLYQGHAHGQDSMQYQLLLDLERITTDQDAARPVVNKKYADAIEQFNYLVYQKGAWILHMLRAQLGEDLYRRSVLTFLKRHAFANVTTEDLNGVIEDLSGRSFDQFFDQWVYHAGFPALQVNYEWLAERKLAKVTVKQTQQVNDQVLLFKFPLKLRFKTKTGVIDQEVEVSETQHDFYAPLAEAPEIVRIDPELALLAKISFDLPRAMVYAQLENTTDALGRVLACRALGKEKDKETVERLKKTLNGDPFYGARIAASKALREIRTDEAIAALLASTAQPDARARLQVLTDLTAFYDEASRNAAKASLDKEKNPLITAAALRSLGKYDLEETTSTVITKYLQGKSFREGLAAAALDAVKTKDDPRYAPLVMKTLKERKDEFPTSVFVAGLDALAWISRNEEDKTAAREFISGYVNDRKREIRAGAITALGKLKDTQAIALVQSYGGNDENDPVQKAATQALQALNESKKIPVELGDLRSEVLELKKQNEELEKKMKDLEAQLKSGGGQKTKRPKILGIF